MLAHYFPNIILFKISNRINLNFGVNIAAVDLKLVRKNKIRLPIKYLFFKTKKNTLILFGSMAIVQKTNKNKNLKFSTFYRDIYRLNVYVNRIFVKIIVQPVGWP